jgi:S-methylmethionine-dependent homocysteine/selenocysteine methylase
MAIWRMDMKEANPNIERCSEYTSRPVMLSVEAINDDEDIYLVDCHFPERPEFDGWYFYYNEEPDKLYGWFATRKQIKDGLDAGDLLGAFSVTLMGEKARVTDAAKVISLTVGLGISVPPDSTEH